jgi:hypothetical protein
MGKQPSGSTLAKSSGSLVFGLVPGLISKGYARNS